MKRFFGKTLCIGDEEKGKRMRRRRRRKRGRRGKGIIINTRRIRGGAEGKRKIE